MKEIGTNMTQGEYLALARNPSAVFMSADEAVMFINTCLCFEASRIKVHVGATVADFEEKVHNGVTVWHPKELHHRRAVCVDAENCYIRFDVASRQYELIDGQLREYVD